jgi:hypothetical protein
MICVNRADSVGHQKCCKNVEVNSDSYVFKNRCSSRQASDTVKSVSKSEKKRYSLLIGAVTTSAQTVMTRQRNNSATASSFHVDLIS